MANDDEPQQVQQQQQQIDQREYDPHNRRTDHWHFEKRLSLDTLVAIIGVAIVVGGPVAYWAKTMESRIQTLEIHDEQRQRQEAARESDSRDSRIALLSKMDRFDEQVTQLRIDVGKLLLGSSTGAPSRR